MISLCSPTFDLNGQLVSSGGTAVAKQISRRAKRVATLDGGAVLVDGGYSSADLTYSISLPDVDGSQHAALHYLLGSYQTALLSCADGCYLVLLSGIANSQGLTSCTADVLEVVG